MKNSPTYHYSFLYKYRFHLISLLVFCGLAGTFLFFTLNSDKDKKPFNPDYIYNTWKVLKFYKNGKLVLNDKKFADLKLRVNRDGSAEWINSNGKIKIAFTITPDGSQIITDNGFSVEDIETIFELKKDRLRFGKRNVISQYEYVMVPVEE